MYILFILIKLKFNIIKIALISNLKLLFYLSKMLNLHLWVLDNNEGLIRQCVFLVLHINIHYLL